MTTTIDPRLEQVRAVLLQSVSEKYQALIEVINKIPLQPEFRANCFLNINQGYLWAKEGISILNFNFDAPTAPAAEAVPEEAARMASESIAKEETATAPTQEDAA